MPARPTLPVLRASSVGLLALVLAGCTGQPSVDHQRAPVPSWSSVSVEVPGALSEDQATASVVGVVGRSGELPALMVGTRTTAADGGRVATWSPEGGGRSSWHQPSTVTDRESRAALVLTDGSATWLAGASWAVGEKREPFLMTSGDRRSWKEVALPRGAVRAGFSPSQGALVEGRPLLLGLDARDRVLAVTPGEEGRVVPLPSVGKGARVTGVSALAAAGRQVLAVLSVSRDGATDETVTLSSADAGASWRREDVSPRSQVAVSGLQRQGDRWVATGASTADDGTDRTGAWSSADGRAWAAETLPTRDEIGQVAGWDAESGTRLGPLAHDGDSLVAPVISTGALDSVLLRRDAAGAWSPAGTTERWDEPDMVPVVGRGDDGPVLARSSSGAAELDVLTGQARWQADITVGDRHEAVGALTFLDGADAPLVASTVATTTTGDGGWWRTYRLDPLSLGDREAITPTAWDPPEAEGLSNLERATGPDGAQVVLGATTNDGEPVPSVRGWYRADPDAGWQPVAGFEVEGDDTLTGVVATSEGWVAVGAHRDGTDVGVPYAPRLWTSGDGVSWSQVPDDELGGQPGDGSHAAMGVCTVADGGAMAVGFVTRAGAQRPAAWTRSAGRWSSVAITSAGPGAAWLQDCTGTSDGAVVTGGSGSTDAAWTTQDGSSFERVRIAAPGDDVQTVRAVPGGLAVAGTLGSGGRTGAALWLSADGQEWHALPVPDGAAASGSDVAVDGKDLVVTAVTETGPRAWRLADYRAQLPQG